MSLSLVELSQRSAQRHDQLAEVRDTDESLWAVVFQGRIRVSVMATDVDTAVERGRQFFPQARVVKVYPR